MSLFKLTTSLPLLSLHAFRIHTFNCFFYSLALVSVSDSEVGKGEEMVGDAPKRSIFRDQAVQKYRQNQEKSVLPRIIAPPVFLFFWILLAILTAAGVVAWLGEVPLYVIGSGVVLEQDVLPNQGSDEAIAVIPFPLHDIFSIRKGLLSEVQIGSTGPTLTRTVDTVSHTTLSPSEMQRRFGISMTDPAQVVSIRLGSDISRRVYAGSPVHVRIQIGSRRLLSLFPMFSNLEKEA